MATPYFTNATFAFLKELKANNSREWFHENKARYESTIKGPAIRLITDFGPHLKEISPHFRADPRPVGGSMFRIHRDVRFSRDKSPYKTAVGVQFRHDRGKDAHAPGFYLHLEPGGCFVGLGCWHPAGPALRKIREAIMENPKGWKKAATGKPFRDHFTLDGESLVRGPKGVDPEHELIDDLKRKDFIGVRQVPQTFVTGDDLPKALARAYAPGTPLVAFLCAALDVPF